MCSYGLWVKRCDYPEWILWWLFLYMVSFLVLFGKFFYVTYSRDPCGKDSQSCRLKENVNGNSYRLNVGTNHISQNGVFHPVTNGALSKDKCIIGQVPGMLAMNRNKYTYKEPPRNDQVQCVAHRGMEPRSDPESAQRNEKSRKPRKKKTNKKNTKG